MAANLCNQLFIIEHKNYLPPIDQKSFLQFFQKSIYGVNTIFQRLVHQFFYSILSKFMVVQCKSFVILTVLKKLKLVLT